MRPLLLILLPLLAAAGSLHAHEPYLLLTANADGTFTAETGFSDGALPEGLKISIRDRGTGEMLSEYPLPANGKLTLKMPAVPYRVAFEGGPGHRISKPGPEWEAPVTASTPAALPSVLAAAPPEITIADEAPKTPPSPAFKPTTPIVTRHEGTMRIVLIVGIFFLFGSIAFALGYSAGRHAR